MGRLTTHVLDIANGRPGAGIRIDLLRVDPSRATGGETITSVQTNNDGRCDAPLLEGEAVKTGEYELVFHAGEYFASMGLEEAEPRFLKQVVIRFAINDPSQHYHVPLLLSPFGYSTYRGS